MSLDPALQVEVIEQFDVQGYLACLERLEKTIVSRQYSRLSRLRLLDSNFALAITGGFFSLLSNSSDSSPCPMYLQSGVFGQCGCQWLLRHPGRQGEKSLHELRSRGVAETSTGESRSGRLSERFPGGLAGQGGQGLPLRSGESI